MNQRVLCVDDDPNILNSLRRQFRKRFDLDVADSGHEALRLVGANGPYAVVVADMQMPQMDGVELFGKLHQVAPLTVRIMLTGNADQTTAAEAINQGRIFRFLTKPCSGAQVADAIEAGIDHYQLTTAEKELLEKTLSGSIKLLTDVLAVVNPEAFGRASRVRRVARQFATAAGLSQLWQVEIAAMLSQVGCVTVPPEVLAKLARDEPLTADEQQMFDHHPELAAELLRNIPRLEKVAEIVRLQEKHFDGGGRPDGPGGDALPIGARILKLSLDLDTLLGSGLKVPLVLAELRGREGWYDPALLDLLPDVLGATTNLVARELPVAQLNARMIIAAPILTHDGILLVSKGQEITGSLLARLHNYARMGAIEEPLKVLAPPS